VSQLSENDARAICDAAEKTVRHFVENTGFEDILPGVGLLKIRAQKLDAGYAAPRPNKLVRWTDSTGAARCEPLIAPRVVRGGPTAAEPSGAVLHHALAHKDSAQMIRIKRSSGCARDPIGDAETWRLSVDCKLRDLGAAARGLLLRFAALGIEWLLLRDQVKAVDEILVSATSCRRLGANGTRALRVRRSDLRNRQAQVSSAKTAIARDPAYRRAVRDFARACSVDANYLLLSGERRGVRTQVSLD
jgi:hypothetical protein